MARHGAAPSPLSRPGLGLETHEALITSPSLNGTAAVRPAHAPVHEARCARSERSRALCQGCAAARVMAMNVPPSRSSGHKNRIVQQLVSCEARTHARASVHAQQGAIEWRNSKVWLGERPPGPHFFFADRRAENCGLLGAAAACAAAACRGGCANVCTGLPAAASGLAAGRSLDRSGSPSTFLTAGIFSSVVWPRLNTLEAAIGRGRGGGTRREPRGRREQACTPGVLHTADPAGHPQHTHCPRFD